MENCKREDCVYCGKLGSKDTYCDYIGFTGRRRMSPGATCDKYMKGTGKEKPRRIQIIYGDMIKNDEF